MEYVNLGSSGVKVSRICLGCMTYGSRKWREWVLEEQEGRPLIRQAIEAGINFFDTADVYSLGASEEILGRALKEFGPPRDRLVVATKVFGVMGDAPNQRGLSRKHIFDAIDDSLRRLQMEYVDLYQIHRFDPATPMEETLEALHDVVRAGKALYIGASSMWTWRFAKMLHVAEQHGWSRFVTMQNHYNLLYREEEREMIPLCRSEGIGLLPWSPLARGKLARPREAVRPRPHGRVCQDPLRVNRRVRRQGHRARAGTCHGAGRAAGPNRPGLAAPPARRHRPHRRRFQNATPPGCHRGVERQTHRRRNEAA